MNPVAKEILMHCSDGDVLIHYGIKRRSGRYPWGSGENPYQHSGDFLSRVNELKKAGWTEKQIAEDFNISTTHLRTQIRLANYERRSALVEQAKSLREKGYSLNQIAAKMGYKNDSSVRALLDEKAEQRMNVAMNTAEFIKEQIDTKGMIDVGTGVERSLSVSREQLNEALYILDFYYGYPTYGAGVPQVTKEGQQTNIKVVCPPGTEHNAVYEYLSSGDANIHTIDDYTSDDGGETFRKSFTYPESMDSSRLAIRYAEDGGLAKDGVIEIRRGVDDLSLGNSHYAQVRILVDGDHYLKGMAVYSDDLPPGVDVMFNTNKSKDTAKMDVLKKVKRTADGEIDQDNPFGSLIKENGGQSYYDGADGEKHLSLINKAREEGDWGEWSDSLPSQFLSKQSKTLVDKQLNLSIAERQEEFDEICALTNPTVKKKLLEEFANSCDSTAVHLEAAALPSQKYQVILPLTSVKDTEIYAPNYANGETVALIRYPHGGTFEIPILKVNNKLAEGEAVIGNTALDAVGISSNVAARLSGADFDGDTVMVIPCNSSKSKVRITSTPALKDLEGFDPKMEYGGKEEGTYQHMSKGLTQTEMGKVSNLITDMTLRGASDEELARAVKHSMVVIDAEKHGLDYKQSEIDNGISALKAKWQGHYDEDGAYHEGASTLISRAKSEETVLKRQGSPSIDPDTGKLVYKTADPEKLYYDVAKISRKASAEPNATVVVNEKGTKYVQFDDSEDWVRVSGKTKANAGDRVNATQVTKAKTQVSTKMAETDDAFTLVSDARTPIELAYATYANKMKSLANEARKAILSAGKIEYRASAKAAYQEEADSLNAKLNVALKNAPRERQAQILANATVAAKKQSNPDMSPKELKKVKQQALSAARAKVGAKRTTINISDREWEAIQAGAISETTLKKILDNADTDAIRKRATPRSSTTELSATKQNQIKNLGASGYTIAQIADRLGVSKSTVQKYLKGA